MNLVEERVAVGAVAYPPVHEHGVCGTPTGHYECLRYKVGDAGQRWERTAPAGEDADDGGASGGGVGRVGGGRGDRHPPFFILGGRPTPVCRKVHETKLV